MPMQLKSDLDKMDNNISGLVRDNIRSLCPYSTARDEYKGKIGIFLDANESPYDSGYNRYPDPRQEAIKAKLSRIKAMPAENIFLGNGSDEPIDLLFRIFCRPGIDNAIAISPSYGMYSVAADINDVSVRSVKLDEDFKLSSDAVLSKCDKNTKLIFLCSPNNPSGNALDTDEMMRIVKESGAIVVIDEAYVDFSSLGSLKDKVLEYGNLVVLQTLSKAWGMAGLRLGIAYAQEYIIRLMSMVKYPYNISQATQDAVSKLLEKPIDEQVKEIIAERERLTEVIKGLSFIKKVYHSDANFLLVKTEDADLLYEHLLKDGIIVRNRNKVEGCQACVRITIGLKEENLKLIESLTEYEKGNIHR